MYVVVEDEDTEECAGGIVILSSSWLTPKKSEAFWPKVKNQATYNKLLKNHEKPGHDWSIIKIKRQFYECDDLLVARKKAQDAEITSDLTDGEICGTRKRYKSNRFESSSSGDEDIFNKHRTRKLARKNIFENPVTCEVNASFNEGQSSTRFASSHQSSPAAAKSGTCVLNASFNEGQSSPRFASSQPLAPAAGKPGIQGSGLITNAGVGSPNSSLTASINAPAPIVTHHTSTTLSTAKTVYEYNVMQMLTTIKEQNTVILEWIRKQNAKEFQFKKADIQLPVEFPLNDNEHLQKLELFLASNQNFTDLCEYFSEFAGPTVTGTVNAILKHTLSNHLAATYSFRGKKGKRAFEDLTLKTAIVRAVKKACNVIRDQPIEDDMKTWLKHAPQRIILQEKKIRARLNRSA